MTKPDGVSYMKYSFCSVAYGSMETHMPCYPLEETMKRLSRIGYDAIEIVCAQPHAWPAYLDAEDRVHIAELLKKYNLKCSSVMAMPAGGPGCNVASVIPEEREWTIQYNKDVIDLAAAWDCHRLAVVPGWYVFGTSRETAWANTLDSVKQIAAYALERDVTLCIEPTATDSNVIDTPDDAILLAKQTGMPNVGLMFDVAHALFRQENPADYVYTAGDYLKHVHFSDSDRLAPGMGTVDFLPLMQALKDINYKDYITMEIGFGRTVGMDSLARKTLEHLKALEAQIGMN